ncbi:MAG: helix-turn-helix domain-containing protein [Prevotella sp.]|nr:helix-turn-helix domain-containing protein [Prevotella sp.]
MKERIKEIQETTGMTQSEFAHHIGLSPAALSSIYGGRTNPTLKTVECIQSKFPNISLSWLINGTGDMFLNAKNLTSDQHQDPQPTLDFDEPQQTPQTTRQKQPKTMAIQTSVKETPINQAENEVKIFNKQKRSITEIRVYFDDLTYESFVPQKK